MSSFEQAVGPYRQLLNGDQVEDIREADARGDSIAVRLSNGQWLHLVRGSAERVLVAVHPPTVAAPTPAPAARPAEPSMLPPTPWALSSPSSAPRRARRP